uniref:Uncharacterized protein n=1 Tax=Anguilla anguilla TaxID=7936 RepID=A0A0E9T829_ANGAN
MILKKEITGRVASMKALSVCKKGQSTS